jgi:hypothetical protein
MSSVTSIEARIRKLSHEELVDEVRRVHRQFLDTSDAMIGDPFDDASLQSAWGRKPENDDVERCNCALAGLDHHFFCGFCVTHNAPRAAHHTDETCRHNRPVIDVRLRRLALYEEVYRRCEPWYRSCDIHEGVPSLEVPPDVSAMEAEFWALFQCKEVGQG